MSIERRKFKIFDQLLVLGACAGLKYNFSLAFCGEVERERKKKLAHHRFISRQEMIVKNGLIEFSFIMQIVILVVSKARAC